MIVPAYIDTQMSLWKYAFSVLNKDTSILPFSTECQVRNHIVWCVQFEKKHMLLAGIAGRVWSRVGWIFNTSCQHSYCRQHIANKETESVQDIGQKWRKTQETTDDKAPEKGDEAENPTAAPPKDCHRGESRRKWYLGGC